MILETCESESSATFVLSNIWVAGIRSSETGHRGRKTSGGKEYTRPRCNGTSQYHKLSSDRAARRISQPAEAATRAGRGRCVTEVSLGRRRSAGPVVLRGDYACFTPAARLCLEARDGDTILGPPSHGARGVGGPPPPGYMSRGGREVRRTAVPGVTTGGKCERYHDGSDLVYFGAPLYIMEACERSLGRPSRPQICAT
ncbi:hypothetical protein CGRA01v4_13491 [Colletotrichum graminicola]|nr:hypothetical protein CGRA01v4_13491 [Colletotrichum graminicola]